MFARLVAIISIALATLTAPASRAESNCGSNPDANIPIKGGCLTVDTHIATAGAPLVVFIHGDSGLTRRYTEPLQRVRDAGINLIVLARPGFKQRDGRRSTGPDSDTYDNYTPAVIDGIAEALQQLRTHHKAPRLVLFGYSGGAMISGILMGRHPGIAEAAVLVGWACDTAKWRAWRELSAGKDGIWPNSLSARDYLNRYPASARIFAITGAVDDNTKPSFAQECVDMLKARGVDAGLEIIARAGHGGVLRSERILAALQEALKPQP